MLLTCSKDLVIRNSLLTSTGRVRPAAAATLAGWGSVGRNDLEVLLTASYEGNATKPTIGSSPGHALGDTMNTVRIGRSVSFLVACGMKDEDAVAPNINHAAGVVTADSPKELIQGSENSVLDCSPPPTASPNILNQAANDIGWQELSTKTDKTFFGDETANHSIECDDAVSSKSTATVFQLEPTREAANENSPIPISSQHPWTPRTRLDTKTMNGHALTTVLPQN